MSSLPLCYVPDHLLIQINKKMDIFAEGRLALSNRDYAAFVTTFDTARLAKLSRMIHLQRKYCKYASRIAYWSQPERVQEALVGCPGQIELVFRKLQARTARYHEIVAEMKVLLQQFNETDKAAVKARLQLLIEKHQPSERLGWVSLQQLKHV